MPFAISVKADGESAIMQLFDHLLGYDKQAILMKLVLTVSSTQLFVDQSDVDGILGTIMESRVAERTDIA